MYLAGITHAIKTTGEKREAKYQVTFTFYIVAPYLKEAR